MATSVRSDTIDAAGPPADLTTLLPDSPPAAALLISSLAASWERTLQHTFDVFRTTIAGAIPHGVAPEGKPGDGLVLKVAQANALSLEPTRKTATELTARNWSSSSLDHVLQAQVEALDTLRGWLSGLRDTLAEVQDWQERQSARLEHLDRQMGLAADLQRELLPSHLPLIAGARLAIVHLPHEHVSGDLYDVFRIDDRRVAWGIADAVGHGLPAGMMSALLKRGLRRLAPSAAPRRAPHRTANSRDDQAPSSPPHLDPADVLRALNQDLLALDCRESHYIAAIVAVYDETTRDLCWARCGMPYPIHVSAGVGTRQIGSEGMLLGVCDEPSIEVVRTHLHPGDVALFHSDGLEALVSPPAEHRPPRPLHLSPWYESLAQRNLGTALSDLRDAARLLGNGSHPPDDVTLLALEVAS